MATITLLLLLLSLFLSSSLARHISLPRTTSSLDVAASLQMAAQALTHKSSSTSPLLDQQAVASPAGDPTSFSLPLHSRDFLIHHTHKDYRSLTLARLQRDEARASAIAARVQLAIDGLKKSDLLPAATSALSAEALQGTVASGSSQGSGEYFSQVGVGSPPKTLNVVLDTGSDVTWVQCQPCTDCYQQSDPIFDPSASSSYSTLPCGSASCAALDISACRNDTCLYQVSYGDGSFTVGDFATESITLGDSSASNIAFGCGHDNEGLFVGSAGLLGLGGGSLSFPSQIQAKSFSYCLVDRNSASTSTLDFGSDLSESAVTASMLKNSKLDTFYYVAMTGISVGGQMLSIPESMFAVDASGSGGIIVDSGTAVTRLQTEAYNSMRDAFAKGTTDLPRADGMALFDTCYDLSNRTSVDVPTVAFHFPEGKELRLPAKNYLIPIDSAGNFCFAFAPTSSPLSIIGNVQQQGTRVAFDLENSVVGFTANKC